MWRPRHALLASLAIVGLGSGCPNGEVVARDSDSASSEETSSGSAGSSDGSTGDPFDASRWIGRYHFENVLLPFGERGDPHGSASLTNLEILPDARATMFYDNCVFDEPILIEYEWRPSPDGWMDLLPGAGESSLRFRADPEVESLRAPGSRRAADAAPRAARRTVPRAGGRGGWRRRRVHRRAPRRGVLGGPLHDAGDHADRLLRR